MSPARQLARCDYVSSFHFLLGGGGEGGRGAWFGRLVFHVLGTGSKPSLLFDFRPVEMKARFFPSVLSGETLLIEGKYKT